MGLTTRQKRWLIVGVLAAVLFAAWLAFGVTLNFLRPTPQQQLDAARARWAANRPANYQLNVTFGSPDFLEWFTVDVQGEGFIIEDRDAERPDWLETGEITLLPDRITDYTVEGVFDYVESVYTGVPAPPAINFCSWNEGLRYETDYNAALGYVETLRYTNCPPVWDVGLGLLCTPALSDCASTMRFELQPQ